MKTKTPYRVQVLPPAWAIMERYRGKRAGFVFDVPTTDYRHYPQWYALYTEKYRYGKPTDLPHGKT